MMPPRLYGPSGAFAVPSDSAAWGAYPSIYVAADGSSLNDGLRPQTPLPTIEQALNVASHSSVRSTIYVGPGSFEVDLSSAPNCRIVGSTRVLESDLVVSAFVSGSRNVTIAGASWVTDEWRGKYLRWVSGVAEVLAECRTKLINQSTSNVLSINFPQVNVLGAAVQVGDIYEIVESTTEIVPIGEKEVIFPFPFSWRGNVELIDVRVSESIQLTDGQWRFLGVEMAAKLWVESAASLDGGSFGETSPQGTEGWGVSHFGAEIEVRGRCALSNAGGRLIVNGGRLVWSAGRIVTNDLSFPHGALNAINAAAITTPSMASAGRFKCNIESVGCYDIVSESSSHIEIYAPIEHQGLGDLYRARDAYIRVGRDATITGSLAPRLWAQFGGQIRLENIAGANLGDAMAGGFSTVTRAAAPWVGGQSVCTQANMTPDCSNIYRSP